MGRSFSLRNGRRARTTDGTAKGSPCEGCQDRECERTGKPCARVEALLPKDWTGRSKRERRVGLDVRPDGDIRAAVIAYRREVIDFLRNTGRDRDAVIAEKYFWKGLTMREIAEETGLSERRVSQVLQEIDQFLAE